MVFLTPEVPRWTPATEEDVRQAIADGVLGESHWWDAKRQLNPGPKANKAFGQDLAAFSIDGGTLVLGLEEDKERGTFALTPQPTANMAERIGSIAATVIDPPLFVVTTVIPSVRTGENGEALGYLLVEVPPSPLAPHQVDGTYFGRGDKQNIRLSDSEVQRHLAQRASVALEGRQLLAKEIDRDPVPTAYRTGGRIYLVGEPLTAAPDVATRLLRDPSTRNWLMETARNDVPEIPMQERDIPPSLSYFQRVETRSGGLAVTSAALMGSGRQPNLQDDPRHHVDDGLLDIEFLRGGGIRVLVGRATMLSARDEFTWVMDHQIVHYARRLVQWVTSYAQALGYRGSWLFGVHVNGLDGASASAYHGRLGSSVPPKYSEDTYEQVTTATLQELVGRPGPVTARLVEDLVWSLGTADRFKDLFQEPPQT